MSQPDRRTDSAATPQPIKMVCAACGKPWRTDPITTTWARSYTCPCGSTMAKGSVTLASWPDGGVAVVDGVERDYEGELLP